MNYTILASRFLGGRWNVLVVAIKTGLGGFKAYVGVGESPVVGNQLVAAHGAKLREHEARAFFPQLKDLPYEE